MAKRGTQKKPRARVRKPKPVTFDLPSDGDDTLTVQHVRREQVEPLEWGDQQAFDIEYVADPQGSIVRFKVPDAPDPKPGSDVVGAPRTRSDVVREMREHHRALIHFSEPLVPAAVHEYYQRLWYLEHQEVKREEKFRLEMERREAAIRFAYSWAGVRQRIWRRIADFFGGRFSG